MSTAFTTVAFRQTFDRSMLTIPDSVGRTKKTGRTMPIFASFAGCPDELEETKRVEGKLRHNITLTEPSTEAPAEGPVFAKLPKGMTPTGALTLILRKHPEMLRSVYQRAVANKAKGVMMTLGGVVKNLVNEGTLSPRLAQTHGDVKFFKSFASTCATARMIHDVLTRASN